MDADLPRWPRPVPTIGDRTSAAERAADPGAWAMSPATREALAEVIGARRDIRRYRPDPVPPEVVGRLLAAAHDAPSVGHSQPWRWVVVTDPEVRQRAATMADTERLAQAAALGEASGRHLLDLDLEGIREAPVGIVVCCDRRVPAAGVLGRATFADADLWSCACAIENLWLAARAEGLGVGWVTLFRPADLLDLVGAPDGVDTLGWLCVGWPDERPPAPGLERRGWSARQRLDEVVFDGTWPGAGAPPPRSHLAPAVAPTTPAALVGARDGGDRLLTPPGSLGLLDRAVDRAVAVGLGDARGGTLVLAAADHPVASLGVTAFEVSVTAEVVAAAVAGEAVGVVAAAAAGMRAVVVDAGVGAGPVPGTVQLRPAGARGDLVGADGLAAADCARLVEGGRRIGAEVAGAGPVAVGEVGVGNTTVAAALTAAFLHLPPEEVVGLGAGADTAVVEAKRAVVAAALHRIGPGDDPWRLLTALGGGEVAALTGVILGVAAHGGLVVLDGLATSVAALAAVRMRPGVAAHLVAGQRSRERAHGAVLAALGLEPLLDLRLRAGEGAGAALATGLLLGGLEVRRGTARTVGRGSQPFVS